VGERSLRVRRLATGFACLVLTSICATAQATMVSGEGVKIDGDPAPPGTRVFVHNLIRTLAGKSAEITWLGVSLRVLGDSEWRFERSSSVLAPASRNGAVTLSTTARHSIKCRCMTATPASTSKTSYTVLRLNDKVYVSVQEGEVIVKVASETTVKKDRTVVIDCAKPKAVVVFAGGSDTLAKIVMGTSIAAAPTILIPKSNMSGDDPDHP
jgi:hypothetical protein